MFYLISYVLFLKLKKKQIQSFKQIIIPCCLYQGALSMVTAIIYPQFLLIWEYKKKEQKFNIWLLELGITLNIVEPESRYSIQF